MNPPQSPFRFLAGFAMLALAVTAEAQLQTSLKTNRLDRLAFNEFNPDGQPLKLDPPSPPPPLNRFRLNAQAAFNISGGFTGAGPLVLNPGNQPTPNGNPYNYNDGYVLTDVSGNAGGQTWNWGYDSPSQVSGNTILMHRATSVAGVNTDTSQNSDNPSFGFELIYDRELGSYQELHFGMEAAANYLNVSLHADHPGSASITQTTDAYSFAPGATPPGAPYQGTFNGPGFLLSSSPVSSVSAAGASALADHQELDADVWGFRLGPYLDYPLIERLRLSMSAGLTTAVLSVSGSWRETAAISGRIIAIGAGSGNDTSLQWGGYAGLSASWQLSGCWSAEAGFQFQSLDDYRHTLGGRAAELNLSESYIITWGINYSF
jgi:hypothetical protein